MRPVLRVAACVCACALGSAAAAHATASARLVYVRGPGAEDCPAEHAVRAAVHTRLGYDPFLVWAHDTLFVDIRRREDAFVTQVRLVDGDNVERGARAMSVRAGSCASVIDALGLTISLTIDPASASGPGPSVADPPAPTPAPAPAPEPGPEASRASPLPLPALRAAPAAPAPPASPWDLRVGLGALGSLNAAPAATVGATLSVGAARGPFSLEIEGRADAPATGDSQAPPARARTWLLAASLIPCARLRALLACPVASVGTLTATARGVSRTSEARGPWSAVGGRLGGEWAFSPRLSLRAYLQVLAALTRDTLWIDDTRIYTLPRWSGGIGTALAWRFR